MRFILALCLLTAGPAWAQETVASAAGATLRALDKVSGEVEDLQLMIGQTARYGRLEIALSDCRYPVDNPASDAFAFLTIREDGHDAPDFSGWMIASSPALNALDNQRYDVWVLRCNN